ncbi:IgGFc-binding protein-like isoform X2 [Ascaphus truei]
MGAHGVVYFCAWIAAFGGFGWASPMGTEFITTFMQNSFPDRDQQWCELRMTAHSDNTNVAVVVFEDAYNRNLTLNSGSTVSVTLPASVEIRGSMTFKNTVLITADKPINIVSLNHRLNSAETSLLYPVASLGIEYYLVTPPEGQPGSFKVFSVVASREATSVEILLKGRAQLNGHMYQPKSILSVNLAPFQGVQILSLDDLSGSRVTSQKSVAVLSGHTCSQKNTQCNHIYEQLLPVSSWGTNFIVPPLSFQEKVDFAFVVASGTTQVTYTVGTTDSHVNMVAGQVLQIEISKVTLRIKASIAVQVTFFHSGGKDRKFAYDPLLMNILDTASYCTSYYIYGQRDVNNYAIVIAKNSSISEITFDGRPSKNPKWSTIQGTEYVWQKYFYGFSFTSHKVEHPTAPFGLQSVGTGALYSYGSPAACVKAPELPPPSCSSMTCPSRQECLIENGKPKCVPQQVDVCWASGDPHYQTFDGLYYDFMGICTYTLVGISGDVGVGLPKFTVQAKNENRGNMNSSYLGQVTFQTNNYTIEVKKSEVGYVRVDNSLSLLPVSLMNGTLRLFQSGTTLIIQLGDNVQVSYDWNDIVRVELTRRYARSVCGMCGNYNQDPADDFQTPAGSQAPDAITFGKSWKVEGENSSCWDDCYGPCLTCPPNITRHYMTDRYCGLIVKTTNGPFSDCHSRIDPKMYVKNCVLDVCLNDGYKPILCQSLKAYADACQREGVKIRQWRDVGKCPLECPNNSRYKSCGRACPATCQDPEASSNCPDPCVETCQCNPGFVLIGGKCLPRESCGCFFEGRSYAPNETFWGDTVCRQRCVCNGQSRTVECKESPCRVGEVCTLKNGLRDCYPTTFGTCSAFGDPHYLTFDGVRYYFQGTCRYQLSALCDHNRGLTDFHVNVSNRNRGDLTVSYTASVYVTVYGTEIQISRQYPNQVMIDGLLVHMPYRSTDGRLSLYRNPSSAVLTTAFGLTVTFDWSSIVTVTLPSTYAGVVGGLCGNFNGNPSDDFIPLGKEAPTSVISFARSWKVGDPVGCIDPVVNPECVGLAEQEKQQRDEASGCGVLLGPEGPFRDCHKLVDPEGYFKSCSYDYCLMKQRQTIFCPVLASYVLACQTVAGTVHPWRSKEFCPNLCPSHSHYEICANGCPVTCSGLTSPVGCDSLCTEGCVCDDGFFLSGDACVSLSQCGSVYRGAYHKVGEIFYVGETCTERCISGKGGRVICSPSSCSPNEECRIQKGVRGCYPMNSAICSASGDNHYKTFDGRVYSHQGMCTYILSQSCKNIVSKTESNLTYFSVKMQTERFGTAAIVTKHVTVKIYNLSLVLRRNQRGVVQVNEVNVRLPATLMSGKIHLECYGQGIRIESDFGLQVTYDLTYHVTVTVPSNYRSRTCGLCGNYNGIAQDDLGPTSSDVITFGETWKSPNKGEICEIGCGGAENPCPNCQGAKTDIFSRDNYCGMMSATTGPFVKCHSRVDPAPYRSHCTFALCQRDGDTTMLCNSIAVYAHACQEAGVTDLRWRNEAVCPMKCSPHSHYRPCADLCSASCAAFTAPYNCPTTCAEGCECDVGYLFDGEGCIPLQECGCFDNGQYYKPNETVLNDDCSRVCTCNPTSGLRCRNNSCAPGERCQILDGVRACIKTETCKSKNCRLKETCKLQNGRAVCVPDYTGTCWAWGNSHYHTFDLLDFDFQGTCTYVLARSRGEDKSLVPFHVETKNDNRGSQAVSYVRLVTIRVYDTTISIQTSEFGKIRVNRALTNLPISLEDGKVNVSQSGLTVIVETNFGLIVTYEWNWHVVITVPSSYYNTTSGLCGNFNQNPSDDQRSPNGTRITSIVNWAGSWKVYDRDPFCRDVCLVPGECPNCEESKKDQYRGEKYCGLIVKDTNGPFRECPSKVNPDNFFDSCLYDLCMNDGAKVILCQALEAYASTCMNQGATIYDWRTPSDCPKICDTNSHYEACGNACPASCFDRTAPAKCLKPCVETCQCNDNFVLSVDKCVPIKSCGCKYNDQYYQPDQEFWSDENCQGRCKCDPSLGIVECLKMSCKSSEKCMVVKGIRGCYPIKYTTCMASGASHYTTFDGKRFDFMGTCIYQLVGVASDDSTLTHFVVNIQNEHQCNKAVSFTKDVSLEVYNQTITMSKDNPQKIKIDGLLVHMPYRSTDDRLSLYRNPSSAVLTTAFGLTVTFDWSSIVTVTLPSTYAGAVGGLCGNFNGNPSDDFIPLGNEAPTSVISFAQRWKVGDPVGCIDPVVNPHCVGLAEQEKRQRDEASGCGVLLGPEGPFRDCHKLVDPEGYFKSCAYDYCLMKQRQTIFCPVLASYVLACQIVAGTVHPWRSKEFCPNLCPSHSHYEICANGCPVTCNGLTSPVGCDSLCREGCVCDDGFVLSGDACVPLSQCGCIYRGAYHTVGEIFYVGETCAERCTCSKGGSVICSPSSCSPNEECRIQKGVRGCYPMKSAICSASGDNHYKTFDGRDYSHQGMCTYILSQSCNNSVSITKSNLTYFSVKMQIERFGTAAIVTKRVTVEIYNLSLVLRRNQRGVVQVNEANVRLPATLMSDKIHVESYGQGIRIETDFGLQVIYDLTYHVTVTVPANYRSRTCGLCGNYNGNAQDDLGPTPSDVITFVETWKSPNKGEICEIGCGGAENPCPNCQGTNNDVFSRDNYCGMMSATTGPFVKCHSRVDPAPYQSHCTFALCQRDGDTTMLCNSIAVYAHACQGAGVTDLRWRNEAVCSMKCPPHSHYSQCADLCSDSCAALTDPCNCPTTCAEGCECDVGYLFDGEGCIPLQECGCFDNGQYYKPNETVLNDDCSRVCTCNPTLGLRCRNNSCAPGERCQILDGVRACINTETCKSKNCRLKETCKLQNGRAVCVPDYTGTCWAWGNSHYHTFDLLDFDFQGTCTYVLAKSSGEDKSLVPFHVETKNYNRGSQAVSYVRLVTIRVYNTNITIQTREFGKIRVNRALTNLPISLEDGKVNVSQSGITAIVETNFGLIVTYEWNWHVVIIVPSSYYNTTSGLCGNFNQNPSDDQRSPNGTQITSIVDWAGSWKVYDRDPFCRDVCLVPGTCPTCEESKKNQYGGEQYCGLIVKDTNGPFSECPSKVNPDNFFDSCLYDLCMNDGAKVILCQALEAYASTCMKQWVTIYDWRTPSDCPKICDTNSHYEACGNACPASCFDRTAPAKCLKPCVETCQCNDNFVLSVDKCVPIKSCGCKYNGQYYQPDQEFWLDENCRGQCKCDPSLGIVECLKRSCKSSEKCMVVNGIRGCYPIKYTTCMASGYRHYTTFDGKKFDFMGTCIYQLVGVTSNDSTLTHFTVNIQNEHRGNKAVSFTKDVTLEVYKQTITMSKDNPQKIKVNGISTELPYYHDTTKVVAYMRGMNLVIKTDFDVTVTFDWSSTVRVILPSTYAAAVNGLCGNNNQDHSDDFTLRDGKIAPTGVEFGEHWKVGEIPGCTTACPTCPVCSNTQKEPYKSEQHCGLLTKSDGPFSRCHAIVNPAPCFEDCIFDACQYMGHQSTVCSNIASYVLECQRKGIEIKEWRTPMFCPSICSQNSHYELCGYGCPITCYGLSSPKLCVASCTEGCYCDNGFVRSGKNCVPIAECGCVFKEKYYKEGDEFYTDSLCHEKCQCGKNGGILCQNTACGVNEECKVVQGIRGCHAKDVGKCVASGYPHYMTFDGYMFDFQGPGTYTLVKVNSTSVNFSVMVENESYGDGTVAVTKSVTVHIEDHVVRMERNSNWTILVKSESYNVPYRSNDGQVWVNQEGNNLILQSMIGLRVLFDRVYYVSVSVPSSFSGFTQGLCGNFNSDISDDFRLPIGSIVKDPAQFGASWKVAGDESNCQGCTQGQYQTCHPKVEADSSNSCRLIADVQGPYRDCHALVTPDWHFKNCVYDMCAGQGGQEALCMCLQAYTTECQNAGVIIGIWRNTTSCPMDCPVNSHYESCTRTCEFTCSGIIAPSTCTDGCFEGCECNPGYVFDGNRCVSLNQCGCVYVGRYLKANESVVSEDCSQRCTCQAGSLSCQEFNCTALQKCQLRDGIRGCQSRDAQCTLTAGLHFSTFDGVSGAFPSAGAFVIASSCNTSKEGQFLVAVDVSNYSGGSKRGMALHVFTSQGLITLNGAREFWLNGRELQAPSAIGNGPVRVQVSRNDVTIEIVDQITVALDIADQVKVTAKERLAGGICGACGNFNGDSSDDLRLKNGQPASSITHSIRSWAARFFSTRLV